MLTLNLIRKLYIPFVLKALQEPKSMQKTIQQSGVGSVEVVFLNRREYGPWESVIASTPFLRTMGEYGLPTFTKDKEKTCLLVLKRRRGIKNQP